MAELEQQHGAEMAELKQKMELEYELEFENLKLQLESGEVTKVGPDKN